MSRNRILIVDDEMEFANTLAERLQLRDFETIAISGGEEVIPLLQGGWLPDVVLLDLKMPGQDGLAILDLIKQHDQSIEVVMITGHGATASAIAGMQRGLFDYLMKPVDIGKLVDTISLALRKKRG